MLEIFRNKEKESQLSEIISEQKEVIAKLEKEIKERKNEELRIKTKEENRVRLLTTKSYETENNCNDCLEKQFYKNIKNKNLKRGYKFRLTDIIENNLISEVKLRNDGLYDVFDLVKIDEKFYIKFIIFGNPKLKNDEINELIHERNKIQKDIDKHRTLYDYNRFNYMKLTDCNKKISKKCDILRKNSKQYWYILPYELAVFDWNDNKHLWNKV